MNTKLEIQLRDFIKKIYEEDENIDEMTVTGDIAGYSTPKAFKKRKKKKRIKYSMNEELTKEDLRDIKNIIRKEVANILRDIWVKRTSWA